VGIALCCQFARIASLTAHAFFWKGHNAPFDYAVLFFVYVCEEQDFRLRVPNCIQDHCRGPKLNSSGIDHAIGLRHGWLSVVCSDFEAGGHCKAQRHIARAPSASEDAAGPPSLHKERKAL
jgi:hypothetical protein